MKKFFRNASLAVAIISAIGGQPVLASNYDLNKYVYKHLEDWDTEFKIDYDDDDAIDVIRNIAKKDDYLSMSLNQIIYDRNGNEPTVKVTYKTTKEQEEYINKELNTVVGSIIKQDMSGYEKVKAINDYLVKRFQYDDSRTSNNAYLALTTGKTTCQGYAMTAYKMLNLAGIENKIVVGQLEGDKHAWNLVKLNNKWYNLDITNNDSVGSDKYFLTSDKVLKDDGFIWNTADYPTCDEIYNGGVGSSNSIGESSAISSSANKGTSISTTQSSTGSNSNAAGKWQMINNVWYYIKNTGTYATGWNLINNNWYYLGSDGAMQTGWIYSGGKWYYCYPGSGAMAANTVIDGYRVDSNGAWIA